jgi:hydroxymethylpyrimidine/phosphomethylpyrimidine kinase
VLQERLSSGKRRFRAPMILVAKRRIFHYTCVTHNHHVILLPMADRISKPRPVVLSIAGHDPSSGAGVTADIKTIAAHGCYGVTCVTSLTVQSTRGVKSVEPVEGRAITETLEELMSDVDVAAVKIGMLGSAEAARAVSGFLRRYQPRHVVLDPVLKSSSGAVLLSKDGLQILKDRILGVVSVITPNADEAAVLTGLPVTTLEEMGAAALRLRQAGARNVIITGGHLDPPSDLISLAGSSGFVTLTGARIAARSTHGTGCAFATAVACKLAQGKSLTAAAKAAKAYVESALKNPPVLGRGIGPVI